MEIKAKKEFAGIRLKKGFSINGLARKMGVSASVVCSMEKNKSVRPQTAQKACTALGEPFDALFYIRDRRKEHEGIYDEDAF